ncbi:MAG: hypothetical protein M5T61_17490 [Acidimicrobiia bacterium]|nr:hypothetical protein [Acidimicrobiia bacterium]
MPTDPVPLHVWLFEWHPSMERVSGQNYQDYETRLAEQRSGAVKATFEQKGWGGIEELVAAATNPYTVGSAIATIEGRGHRACGARVGVGGGIFTPRSGAGLLLRP